MFKRFFSFIKKLYIPFYLYFILSVFFGTFFIGFFKSYSILDFDKVSKLTRETRSLLKEKFDYTHIVNQTKDLIAVKEKIIKNKNSIADLKENKKALEEELLSLIESSLHKKIDEDIFLIKNHYSDKIKDIDIKILNVLDKYADKELKDSKSNVQIGESNIPISAFLKFSDSDIYKKYPIFLFLIRGRELIIIFVVWWLWPVYKYNFKKIKFCREIEKRIVQLPYTVFFVVWIMGAYTFLIRSYFVFKITGSYFNSINTVYFLSFIMFSSIVGFFNLGITSRYVNNKIALPIFKENNLHGLKKGKTFQITSRIIMMICFFSIIPMFIMIYIPVSFNLINIMSLLGSNDMNIYNMVYIFIPVLLMFFVLIYFLIPQIMSLVWFRRSIQGPINRLIERMKRVANGDFVCKASVLSNDEIGQLRGHFNNMLEGLQEREKIRDTFGKFVSLEIAEKIMKENSDILQGEEIETTIMFTDIREFTSISEKMPPKELVNFLNTYFSYICKPIIENNGVVNKFIGDSVMAVFSPVFGVEDHAGAALKAALGIRKQLKILNQSEDFKKLKHGVGIHTGILVAGNVGTDDRMEYTVIGDTVNVASRVESQTKVFEEDILISEDMYKKIKKESFEQYDFIPFDPVIMKGKSESIVLYKVIER